jgi:hypothetical protein
MYNFIQKLPTDIILQIIPYTYNIQNKNLLDDIINYTESKMILLELYYSYWILEAQSVDPEEDKNWLINDIFAYANNYNAIMWGYIDNFYNIFKRNIKLLTKKEIDKYIDNLQKKSVKTQINIFLGLLNINERIYLIKRMKILLLLLHV